MTDDQREARAGIVAFAAQIGGSEREAEEKAIRRGWLDAEGAPTQDGLAMLREFGDQRRVRTVFRGL
jgi:hypothetical protein